MSVRLFRTPSQSSTSSEVQSEFLSPTCENMVSGISASSGGSTTTADSDAEETVVPRSCEGHKADGYHSENDDAAGLCSGASKSAKRRLRRLKLKAALKAEREFSETDSTAHLDCGLFTASSQANPASIILDTLISPCHRSRRRTSTKGFPLQDNFIVDGGELVMSTTPSAPCEASARESHGRVRMSPCSAREPHGRVRMSPLTKLFAGPLMSVPSTRLPSPGSPVSVLVPGLVPQAIAQMSESLRGPTSPQHIAPASLSCIKPALGNTAVVLD